jgi:hypothetical protein
MRRTKLYQLMAVAGCLSTAVATTPVFAGDSVNVSMPTNNPPVSEYKITLLGHDGNSGKNWVYKVEWVKGKNLSHWDLSLGSCLGSVTNISGGGTRQQSGDPSNANPASGADASVKSSKLIKWDTQGGTFTVTMDKAYQTTQVPVLAKTATVYNTGMVTGPDCTKEVTTAQPTVYDFTPPVPSGDPSPFDGNGSKCKVNGTTLNVKGRLLGNKSTVTYSTDTVAAEIVNNSGAPQEVTLVTYKEYYGHENYSNVLDAQGNIVKRGQTVYDYQTVMVPVGVSQLEAAMPGCSTQIDLVCGPVKEYLGGGNLYGNSKLDWYHAHETSGGKDVWCNYEVPPVDTDEDGIADTVDNCPAIANANQANADGDSMGDACDALTDSDGDTVADDTDNCPNAANMDQADVDSDGTGDVCDALTDSDGDTVADDTDNCPNAANMDQADVDSDGTGDVCDSVDDRTPLGDGDNGNNDSGNENAGGPNMLCSEIMGSNGAPMSLIDKFEWSGNSYAHESGTGAVSVDGDASGGTFSSIGTVKVAAVIVKGGTVALVDQDGNDSFSNAGLTNKGGQTADISNIQFCQEGVFDSAGAEVCLWSANKDADGNYINIEQVGCVDAEKGKFYAIEAAGEFSNALEAE